MSINSDLIPPCILFVKLSAIVPLGAPRLGEENGVGEGSVKGSLLNSRKGRQMVNNMGTECLQQVAFALSPSIAEFGPCTSSSQALIEIS